MSTHQHQQQQSVERKRHLNILTMSKMFALFIPFALLWTTEPHINNNSHLSGNCIGTVCGLETARCLEELHVAKQRLPEGERFTIDRTSIDGIKASCDVVDVVGSR